MIGHGIISISKSCHYGHDENGDYKRFTDTPKTSHSIRSLQVLRCYTYDKYLSYLQYNDSMFLYKVQVKHKNLCKTQNKSI